MKLPFQLSSLALLFVSIGLFPVPALAETLFVQSAQGALKEKPDLASPVLHQVPRGTPLEIESQEGAWFRVKSGAKSGYIHRLFVGKQKPAESDALRKIGEDQDLAKSARRRSSSYAVAATTRGLTAGNRVREGRDRYPSDPEALQKMEGTRIDPDAVRKFQLEGGLQ